MSAPQDWSGEFDNLLPAARNGSPSAKNRIWEIADSFLRSRCGGIVEPSYRGKTGESELWQSTLFQAWSRFEQFSGETAASFFSWLLRIRRRQYLNLVGNLTTQSRDVRRELSGAEDRSGKNLLDAIPGDAPTPSMEALVNEEQRALTHALAQLPEDDRRALQLRLFEGREFGEIGRILGRSTEASRKLYARAFAKLSTLLERPP